MRRNYLPSGLDGAVCVHLWNYFGAYRTESAHADVPSLIRDVADETDIKASIYNSILGPMLLLF